MVSIIYGLVLVMLSSLYSAAKNVAVDLSIGAVSDNIYPSLQEALQVLYDNNNQMIDYDNSITLLPSCASHTLSLSNATLRGLSTGGILNITFPSMSDQKINQFEICSQLPIIDLSSANSFFNISSLTYLSISGVTLQYSASENINLLSNIATVNFSSFCLNNTEPTLNSTSVLLSPMKTRFIFDQISALLMSNGIYIYDSLKTLQISGSNYVSLTSMTYVILSTTRDQNKPALNISSPILASTIVNVTGMNVSCQPGDIVMPSLIYTSNITSVDITNYQLSNCNFSKKNSYGQYLIYIYSTLKVNMSEVVISNINIAPTPVLSTNSLFLNYFMTPQLNISMSIELKNWNVSNTNISYYSAIVLANIKNNLLLNSVKMENISITYSQLFYYSYFMYFYVVDTKRPSTAVAPLDIQISKLQLTQSQINDRCKAFYFVLDDLFTVPTTEVLRLNITSMSIRDTLVDGATVLSTQAVLVYMKNFQVQNVTLTNAGLLRNNLGPTDVLSTLFVLDSVFTDMKISSNSVLFQRGINENNLAYIECTSFNKTEGFVYALTKPFIVSNSTFNNLKLSDNSKVVRSTSPEIVIQNNVFNNITIQNSQILNLGGYLDVITGTTYCVAVSAVTWIPPSNFRASFSTAELPTNPIFYPYAKAENALFKSYPDAGPVFYEARNMTAAYDQDNLAFLLSVTGNLFTNIIGDKANNVIVIQEFAISNSSVSVQNNTIRNCSSAESSLVQVGAVSRVFWSANSIISSTVRDYFLDLSTSELKVLIIQTDLLVNNNNMGGYRIQSPNCASISLQNISAQDLFVTKAFMKITCDLLTTQIAVRDSQFKNIAIESTIGVLAPNNLVAIHVKNSQGSATSDPQALLFQNNSLENVTLSNIEGFVTKLLDSSLIQISASHSALAFDSNNLTMVSVRPRGSILMSSIPSITITNSKFIDLIYWDPKGALNLVFQSLIVNRTTFNNTNSRSNNGAGLMRFTNPHPNKNSLNIFIQNSVFSNNSGPTGTIFYAETTSMQMNFVQNNVSNNILRQQDGGLFHLNNISNSALVIEKSNFDVGGIIDQEIVSSAISANALSIKKSLGNISVEVTNCNLNADSSSIGAFFSIYSNVNLKLNVTQFAYSSDTIDSGTSPSSKYGIIQTDSIQVSLDSLSVSNVSLINRPLFFLNCSTSTDSSINFEMKNSTFENLSLDEGIFLIDSQGENELKALNNFSIWIENCSFSNLELNSHSSSYFASTVGTGIFTSWTRLLGRSSYEPDNIHAIIIKGSLFTEITTNSLGGGVLFSGVESLYNGMLSLQHSEFQAIKTIQHNSSSEAGSLIRIKMDESSSSSIFSEIFTKATAVSTISVLNCTFQNMAAFNGGFLFWESQSKPINLSLVNSSFKGIELANNGLFFMKYSPSNLENNFDQQISRVVVIASNCLFTGLTANNGGVFYLEVVAKFFDLTVTASNFQQINVNNGAILHIQELATSATTKSSSRILASNFQTGNIFLISNQFTNLSALNGGILYEDTPNGTLAILLEGSQIENITVLERGGIFYLNQPILTAMDNNISECYAESSGVVIYSSSPLADAVLSNFINNNTISNSLNATTPMISFAPSNLKVEILDNTSSLLHFDDYNELNSSPTISNLTSYSLSPLTMRFTLIHVGVQGIQTVIDNSTNPSIRLTFTAPDGSSREYSSSQDSCSNSICTFDPSSIRLVGKAEEKYTVNATYISKTYIQSQIFYIKLRVCLPGEVNDTISEECIHCERGSYSLVPSDGLCNVCPEGAKCLGGANILIDPGYYRSLINDSLKMVACNDSGGYRCQGGIENNCTEKFTGPACLQCNWDKEYLPSDSGECSKCLSQRILIFVVVLILIGSTLYQILLMMAAYRKGRVILSHNQSSSSRSPDNQPVSMIRPGAFMIIFATFSQITSILADNDSGVFKHYTGVTSSIANTSQQIMVSLKCLIYFNMTNPLESMKVQLLFMVFSPIIKLALLIIFESIKNLFCSTSNARTRSLTRIGTATVVLIFLEQPGIIGFLGNYLTCRRLDPHANAEYIVRSNNIECGTPEYNYIRNIIVIPAFLFWAFLLPAGLFIILRINRERLYVSENLQIILGHLYTSYKQKAFYWGLLLFVMRMGIFIFNALLTKNQTMKNLILLVFFHLYFKFYSKVKPYENESLHQAEKLTIFSYNAILILLLFQSYIDIEWIQTVLSTGIIIITTYTNYYILFRVFYLRLIRGVSIVRKFKHRTEDKRILIETLRHLQSLHSDPNSRMKDKNFRRAGISLALPTR